MTTPAPSDPNPDDDAGPHYTGEPVDAPPQDPASQQSVPPPVGNG